MRNTVILAMLVSFLISAPAMAVKSVPKDKDQPAENNSPGNQTPEKPSGSAPEKASPPPAPDHIRDGKDDRTDRQQPPARKPEPKPERIIERDRFIDENDDGINDRLKKPPETVKKKKDSDEDKRSRVRRSR